MLKTVERSLVEGTYLAITPPIPRYSKRAKTQI